MTQASYSLRLWLDILHRGVKRKILCEFIYPDGVTDWSCTVTQHFITALYVGFSCHLVTHKQHGWCFSAAASPPRVRYWMCFMYRVVPFTLHTPSFCSSHLPVPLQFLSMSHWLSPCATQQLTAMSLVGITYPVYKQRWVTPPTHIRRRGDREAGRTGLFLHVRVPASPASLTRWHIAGSNIHIQECGVYVGTCTLSDYQEQILRWDAHVLLRHCLGCEQVVNVAACVSAMCEFLCASERGIEMGES